jgi:hypothetical protein
LNSPISLSSSEETTKGGVVGLLLPDEGLGFAVGLGAGLLLEVEVKGPAAGSSSLGLLVPAGHE